jgi:hypothetical protein
VFLLIALLLQLPPMNLAEADRTFVCPEGLSSDAARAESLHRFFEVVARAAPDRSVAETLRYRRLLLAKHGCRQTLTALNKAEAAVRAGAVWDQAWLPLQTAGISLFGSATIVEPFDDPRTPGELAVETYVKAAFAAPQRTNVTRIAYDVVVSHAVYYCRSRRYALVENDYFLQGRAVLKDPSPQIHAGHSTVYALEPVPPGSLNAVAAAWACRSVGAGAATA